MKWMLPVVLMLALSGCGFETVDVGHRGLKISFGEIIGEPLPEGLYFYNPFTTSIKEMDVREQKLEGKTIAFTRDVQQVVITYTLNYRPDAFLIGKTFKEVGKNYADILLPQVVEGNMKASIAQWDALHLVENREKATRAAEKAIRDVAAPRIIVTRLEMSNMDFHDEFEKATEAKVRAQQDAERAKNETVKIQEEANQRVISAKAEAESIRIRTQALATSPALVQYEAVRKWDGKLPQYMMGGQTLPFIQLK